MTKLEHITLSAAACSLVIGFGFGCGDDKPAQQTKSDTKTETAVEDKPKPTTRPDVSALRKMAKKDLPPPPASALGGKARVINLYTAANKPTKVDVWAVRSFTYGPVQLAKDIDFGTASPWFRSAKGQSIQIVEAGANPDQRDKRVGSLFYPRKGQHITGILYTKKDGKGTTGLFTETSATPIAGDDTVKDPTKDTMHINIPDAPPAGKAYVVVRAGQIHEYFESMKPAITGWAFRVGDGTGKCRPQRVETQGYTASILGGTQPTKHDVEPGKQIFTLHKRMARECDSGSELYRIEVDVKADSATLVYVYTADRKTLTHGVFPMAVNTAKPYGTNVALKKLRDAERKARKAKREADKAAKKAKPPASQ